MTPLRIEVSTRRQAIDLLRTLAPYHPWVVQLRPELWVVSGRVSGEPQLALGLLREWATERELRLVGVLGDEPFVLETPEILQ